MAFEIQEFKILPLFIYIIALVLLIWKSVVILLLCQIADEHKAVLLADIAHISGLVAAQVSEISTFKKILLLVL